MLSFTNFFFPLFFIILTSFCGVLSSSQYAVSTNNDANYAESILSEVDWPCKSNLDCTVKNALCVNNSCQCPRGHVYNANMTSCLEVANSFGDRCVETIQCSRYLLNGAKCVNNKCNCGPGFHYLHGRCHKTLELLDPCKTNDDCYVNSEIGSTVCEKGTCRCKSGFYQREHRSCRPIAKVLGDDCMIDLDCKFIKNAYCEFPALRCTTRSKIVANYLKSSSNSDGAKYADKIVSVKGSSGWRNCTTDNDCKIYENSICGVAGRCTCKRAHFTSDNKKCIAELGESCSNNFTDIWSAVCIDNIWTCEFGMVPSIDKRSCRKVNRAYNSSCLVDVECYILGPDGVCRNGRCTCNENSRYISNVEFCWKSLKAGEKCKVNEDCYMNGLNGTLVCANNICSCPSGSHMNSNETACISDHAELGMFCEKNANCATYNSICVNNVCACNATAHYYEFNKTCILGIRGSCNGSDDCKPANSTCLNGTCACKKNYVAASIGSCLKASEYGRKCEHDVQCKARTLDAICSRNGTCICDEDRHLSSSRCYKTKYLGEACTFHDECYLEFGKDKAFCRNGKCTCDWNYLPEGKTKCAKESKERPHPSKFSGGSGITFSRICLTTLSLVWIFFGLI